MMVEKVFFLLLFFLFSRRDKLNNDFSLFFAKIEEKNKVYQSEVKLLQFFIFQYDFLTKDLIFIQILTKIANHIDKIRPALHKMVGQNLEFQPIGSF